MNFTKMNGLGNDFVVMAQYDRLPDHVAELAQNMCNRHFGVGADGLVFILPSDKADFRMRIINADGSEAEQCGNAIRCVGKYVYDHQMTTKKELSIETLAGIQHVFLHAEGDRVSEVKVDMGPPVLIPNEIPTKVEGEKAIQIPIEVKGKTFHFTAVSMGNPHAVIFVDDAVHYPVETWGPLIEVHPMFPKKTNVEFVTVRNDGEVDMRVWERGVGQTLACGTGACATAVASHLVGKTGRKVLVHLKGGDLLIEWNLEDHHVYMTGQATETFSGTWLL
ncbi:diaminopimelate epimerase [Microaerobacter geothermalis]|uniref:diaminopimelate epimerase n=1 Tax=Microaerobacter geothermalis TaxID=674972 RepID=UPI001F265C93|nr:diaminopimelate epimerase [Microaerobacter geothermalis]MCF6094877.1 diaminopimelate epimerase [Microaerobacter geothermalis]